jgi:hypothetical protein
MVTSHDEEPKERTRERREKSEERRDPGGRRENFLAYKRRGP